MLEVQREKNVLFDENWNWQNYKPMISDHNMFCVLVFFFSIPCIVSIVHMMLPDTLLAVSLVQYLQFSQQVDAGVMIPSHTIDLLMIPRLCVFLLTVYLLVSYSGEDRVVPRIILSSANTMRISHRSYQNKSIPKPGLISQ